MINSLYQNYTNPKISKKDYLSEEPFLPSCWLVYGCIKGIETQQEMLLVIEGDLNGYKPNLLLHLRGESLLYCVKCLLESQTLSMLSKKLFLNQDRYNQFEILLGNNVIFYWQ